MTDTKITDTSPMQLIVFERKTERSAYRYFGTYKAGDQAQLTASENTIRNTFAALHASDGVRWSVVACEAGGLMPFFGLSKRVGRGRRSRRDAITLRSLDGLGVIALEFPEVEVQQGAPNEGVHVFDNGAELKRMLEDDAKADRIEQLDRDNWLSDDTLEDLSIAMGVETAEREG